MITATALLLAVVTFLVQTYAWYWPHELHGLVDEAWLLVLCATAAALIAVSLCLVRQTWRHMAPISSIALSCLYLGAVLAEVRAQFPAGIRLVPHGGYLYAADGCEFAVRFPRRPHETAAIVRLGGETAMAKVATQSDVGRVAIYRAECVLFAAPLTPSQRTTLIAAAPQHMIAWATAGRVSVGSVSVDDSADPAIAMQGQIETADDRNRPRIARIQARTLIGNTSMLTLLVSELGSGDASQDLAGVFLRSAGRR